MKKLQSKKTKQKSVSTNDTEKQGAKMYVSDMGIGFRVLDFRAASVN